MPTRSMCLEALVCLVMMCPIQIVQMILELKLSMTCIPLYDFVVVDPLFIQSAGTRRLVSSIDTAMSATHIHVPPIC